MKPPSLLSRKMHMHRTFVQPGCASPGSGPSSPSPNLLPVTVRGLGPRSAPSPSFQSLNKIQGRILTARRGQGQEQVSGWDEASQLLVISSCLSSLLEPPGSKRAESLPGRTQAQSSSRVSDMSSISKWGADMPAGDGKTTGN